MLKVGGFLARAVLALMLLLAGAWSFGAIFYQGPQQPHALRIALAASSALAFAAAAVALLLYRSRVAHWAAVAGLGALLIGWWSTIVPAEHKDWAPDVARLPVIRIEGDNITVENVRDFDWTGADAAKPHWETRRYHLSNLESLDLFTSVWGNPNIAHVFLSFGFKGEGQLAMSVEVRRVNGEIYDPIASAFRKDNLVLVAADEADVAKVRANFRGETVSLYRLAAKPPRVRAFFEQYVGLARRLIEAPMFYNTLTTNCTTTDVILARHVVGDALPLDWRILVSGRLPDYLYDLGSISRAKPLAETKQGAVITELSKEAGDLRGEPYSDFIRRRF
ncbi:MAG: hypothetical protein CTY15_02485 [Methylocystis sp.]|nr:MAG: hypothetical protein CTY15_02485 [Methylocystis sp.]